MPKKGAILDKVRALRDKKATANAAIEQADSTEVAISTEEEALRLGKKDGEKATDAEGSGVAGEADQSVEELCEGEGGSASERFSSEAEEEEKGDASGAVGCLDRQTLDITHDLPHSSAHAPMGEVSRAEQANSRMLQVGLASGVKVFGKEVEERMCEDGMDDEALPLSEDVIGGHPHVPGGMEVWVEDHRLGGGQVVYEVAVRMRGLHWIVDRTWKQIAALRAALAAAAEDDGGQARLPVLPQESAVTVALALVARAQTRRTRQFAEELNRFFRLLVLAVKASTLLSRYLADWLEAAAQLSLLEEGLPGPLVRGCAGRYRVLLKRDPESRGRGVHSMPQAPNGRGWGVCVVPRSGDVSDSHGADFEIESERTVLGNQLALQVSLGKVQSSEGIMDGENVWFECVTTNGKRAAVRAAPESDECLLGLPDQFQILHILAWSESSIPCDNNRGARQRSLVMHAHVMLADIAATFSDTTASFSLPLYSAQTQHSACRQGKAEGEVHRDEGRDKGLMRSLNRLMKKADVLGQAAVGAPSALAGDEEWALKLPPALAQGRYESLVFEARGCWWETTMIKDMASEGQDKMTEGLDEVRVRLPFKRACVAVVDIRLRLTRTQAEKRRLQVLKAAHDSRLQPLRALLIPHDSDGKAETGSWCILLATIQALGSHAPSALSAAAGPHPARIEPSHNALGDFGVASSHHSFALQAVYRLILSAGIELSLIGYLRAMKSVHNIEQDGQDEVWGQARSVAVDLLLDKGCEFIVQAFSDLVEEVVAAARDLDISQTVEGLVGGNVTEGDSEIMEKCELLAEVIMRFFDAIAGALGATLDSLTLKVDQTSRDKKQHAMSHTQLWSFLLGLRDLLRCKGDGADGGVGETQSHEPQAAEPWSRADDELSSCFLSFVARGLQLCFERLVQEGFGASGEAMRNQKTFSWVACAFQFNGEDTNSHHRLGGLGGFVWKALEERRRELMRLIHEVLDAHVRCEYVASSTVVTGGRGLGDDAGDLWQVARWLRREWQHFLPYLSSLPPTHRCLSPPEVDSQAEADLLACRLRDVLVSLHGRRWRGDCTWRRHRAAVAIQQAVREWLYVFVSVDHPDTETLPPSYTMVPHGALVTLSTWDSDRKWSLAAPSSFEEIAKTGWVREAMEEEGSIGEGMRGRVVAAGNVGHRDLSWEEMCLADRFTERCLLAVQRNGDSSLTIRSVSGRHLSSSAAGGHVQRRVYFEYDSDTGLFRLRSGAHYICLAQGHVAGPYPQIVAMIDVSAGCSSLWNVEVHPSRSLGVPCPQFVGLCGGPAETVARFEGLQWPLRIVLKAQERWVVTADLQTSKVLARDGHEMLARLPARHHLVFTLALNVFALLLDPDADDRRKLPVFSPGSGSRCAVHVDHDLSLKLSDVHGAEPFVFEPLFLDSIVPESVRLRSVTVNGFVTIFEDGSLGILRNQVRCEACESLGGVVQEFQVHVCHGSSMQEGRSALKICTDVAIWKDESTTEMCTKACMQTSMPEGKHGMDFLAAAALARTSPTGA